MKALVAYDGTLQSKDILRSWLKKVRGCGDELVVLHIFESRKFIDCDAEPGAEDIAGRESLKHLADARAIAAGRGDGARASIVLGEGIPEEEIIEYAEIEGMDVLLCPARCRSLIRRFGEVLNAKGKEAVEEALFDDKTRFRMATVGAKAA